MLRVHFCYMKNKVLDIILFASFYCTDLSFKKQLHIMYIAICSSQCKWKFIYGVKCFLIFYYFLNNTHPCRLISNIITSYNLLQI